MQDQFPLVPALAELFHHGVGMLGDELRRHRSERAGVDAYCYVVIVTRGHVHDVDVLRQALRSPARYVGLMASRGKRARVLAALREEGFTETELARVHTPIGLEIGAETPAELAISIAAELIRVRAGAEG